MLTIRRKTISLLVLSLPIVVLMTGFRPHIFTVYAGVVMLMILCVTTILYPVRTQTLTVVITPPVILQIIFIILLWIRVDLNIEGGYLVVYEQILYLLIFTIAAVYSMNDKTTLLISFLTLFYLLTYIVRIFYLFDEAKYTNLWSGYVIFTLLPLVLMYKSWEKKGHGLFISMLSVFCIFLLFILTARIPTLCVIIFFAMIYVLPRLPRQLGTLIYFGLCCFLLYLVHFYIQLKNMNWWGSIDIISREIFSKPIFTGREVIWNELINYIQLKPWLGYCSNCATNYLIESSGLRTLSSHNNFIEILYRTGLIGLVIFISIFYTIWIRLYNNKKDYQVLLAASFLLSSFIFMSSGAYWFGGVVMINCLAWLIVGLGYGKASKHRFGSQYINHARIIDN